jgi:hypothetical protein
MGSDIVIVRPDPPSVVADLSPIVSQAQAFQVTDIESDRIAQENGRKCRLGERAIEDHFAGTKRALIDAKKAFDGSVAGLVGPIAQARSIYFAKSDAYQQEKKREAEAESRRLQEVARKQEEERQIMDAIDADESGKPEVAESILAEAPIVPTVTVAPAVAKVQGVTTRELWSANVHDVRTCLRFMIERDEWIPLLEKCIPVLETGLNPLARAQRNAMSIPGVNAVATTSRATR